VAAVPVQLISSPELPPNARFTKSVEAQVEQIQGRAALSTGCQPSSQSSVAQPARQRPNQEATGFLALVPRAGVVVIVESRAKTIHVALEAVPWPPS